MAKKEINKKSMLRKGTLLHDNYRIDSYLSSGGFGNTYKVTHIGFNKVFAIKEFFLKKVTERESNSNFVKVSNPENNEDFEAQLKKFNIEAQRLDKLSNEHIVRVYDWFPANGTAYYVMDFIEGENLAEYLEHRGKPLPEKDVEDILRQVLDALQEVHSNNIWHLDLKPANIMIDTEGTVKLIDFGASKQSDPDKLTATGIAYTAGYAPLEQVDKNKDKFGPWTDFYALGATLFNLLTNTPPPVPSTIMDDLTPDKSKALPMPGVSIKMRGLVLWLMRCTPKHHPRSVSEILAYLDMGDMIEERDDTDDGTKLIEDLPPKRNKLLPWVCVGALLAGGGIGWWASDYHRPIQPEEVVIEDTSVVVEELPIMSVTDMKITLPEGECTYTGEVDANGLPDGHGKAIFDSGDICEGTFVNGKIHGDDISYRFSDGDIFRGTLKNGELVEGTYTVRKSGNYFVGSFTDNEPYDGKWYDKNGELIKSIDN